MDQAPKSESLTAATLLQRSLQEHLEAIQALLQTRIVEIERSGEMICAALREGHKVLLCGNGGSAADAQHIAAELVGRYELERRAWPSIALTTDTSALTALSNDFGYEEVFARQVQALAGEGDVLIALSTSGASANVIRAAEAARTVELPDNCPYWRYRRTACLTLRCGSQRSFPANLTNTRSTHNYWTSVV